MGFRYDGWIWEWDSGKGKGARRAFDFLRALIMLDYDFLFTTS